jgi:hypothetical protein
MARVKGGFFTSYLSDLAFPPWFYIYIRGLAGSNNTIPKLAVFRDWFGVFPERAFVSILTVGVISEIATFYWPTGIISGTFDPLDIVSYTVGLMLCYYIDKRGIQGNHNRPVKAG